MNHSIDTMLQNLFDCDPLLQPYENHLIKRFNKRIDIEKNLMSSLANLSDMASGHEYFGLHLRGNEWIFREWAPNATSVYFLGNMTDWQMSPRHRLERLSDNGIWEIRLPIDSLQHGDLYRLKLYWPEGEGDRIPAYARRVVQDPVTQIFNAQVWQPDKGYHWRYPFKNDFSNGLIIYETHIGMAQDAERIGSYREFTDCILPRIAQSGYNAMQLMAIQEHPYYGSFGYHVSNFFSVSSRFGTPYDFKELVDTAHELGLAVIIDLIHSHASMNEVEGLGNFDGTRHLYFHQGERGYHPAWGSRCFNYRKHEVIHFLLSNCRYFLDEYHIDGYRFDGITSMLYYDHGLNRVFLKYDDYFDSNIDEDAYNYLYFANKVIHEVRPDVITIAEDVSGMPGLALPIEKGGTGFDYRFAMGVPDYWIKLIKEIPDEHWPIGHIWFELTNRRKHEKTISYAECHDQAIVGDQTLIFRLIGEDMYHHMTISSHTLLVDRGISLHKLIRLVTLMTSGHGYLNFMGNEFGHPEWIDFPRQDNNWSYQYACRKWHLVDNKDLLYHYLSQFDKDMIQLVKASQLLRNDEVRLLHDHNTDQVLAFERSGLIVVINFHPYQSYQNYIIQAAPGKYKMILDSDHTMYFGHGRLSPNQYHFTTPMQANHFLSLYLPSRTGIVLQQ